MRMCDTPSPAKELLKRELAALDIVTKTSPPGTITIIALRLKDGTFLRGLLEENQKDRIKVRWRFHRRQNIPMWHPDAKKAEWQRNIPKKKIAWLSFKARSPVVRPRHIERLAVPPQISLQREPAQVLIAVAA